MTKYISTYFYQDDCDDGASYGNIFLPLNQRNIIYWQTVYTLFFSSIVFNKGLKIDYLLFTNTPTFPFRKEIESLGVKVYDDLKLTSRNVGKWATVKFFFDVIDFINSSDDFKLDDSFVMLDTDVVSVNSADGLFGFLDSSNNAIAYCIDDYPSDFHGLSLLSLQDIGREVFQSNCQIDKLIGGEFFCFKKQHIDFFNKNFKSVYESDNSRNLTTEEQILTIVNAYRSWEFYPKGIFRVWTTMTCFKLPNMPNTYIFLHFPSEKTVGLNKLFNLLINLSPESMEKNNFQHLLNRSIGLNKPFSLYLKKIYLKIITLCKAKRN
jgi:hypothetical protein